MINSKVSIAAILTCYNRKNKTLICLENLFTQDGINDIDLEVYLVDDGSTDGTSNAVHKNFPKANVLQGDGTLFWNGGMRFAFAEAIKNNHDYYLWLNDDTFLHSRALRILLGTAKKIKIQKKRDTIIVGAVNDTDSGQINYGGRIRKSRFKPLKISLLKESSKPQQCDTFNGNIVLIPHKVVQAIGNISQEFSKQHSGDIDYGLRAKYAGFESWVAPGIIGECDSNPIEGTIFDSSLSIKERMNRMNTPQGVPPAKEWMVFTKRHAGVLWPYYWLRTVVRVLFPWTYLYLRKPQK